MLKIVYPICCGMNVHKNFLVACYVKAICGKKKTTRISRAGAYIKPLLVQCANAAIKSKKHPDVRNRYLDISKTLSYLICQIFICLKYIP